MAKEGRHDFVLTNYITRKRKKTITLDNVTSESNARMYPLNDEKGEHMPVWARGYVVKSIGEHFE